MRIALVNGPNLNLLGIREPGIYGNRKFEDYLRELGEIFNSVEFEYFQSNSEGELIDALHQFGDTTAGIVLNAGAYTHSSMALGDAVAAIKVPVVEVHISNLHNREKYRLKSYLTPYAAGSISGFGLEGYRLAVQALTDIYQSKNL